MYVICKLGHYNRRSSSCSVSPLSKYTLFIRKSMRIPEQCRILLDPASAKSAMIQDNGMKRGFGHAGCPTTVSLVEAV